MWLRYAVDCLMGRPSVVLLPMRGEELKGHLDALLLAALEDGPRHGYAVIEALRESTGGRLDLPTGTIYPALRRLEAGGLIRGSWSVVGGRQRREYRLTAAGARALSGKRADWRDFAAMVSAALEARPWPNPA
jgi:PadR family transcriptional regulator PadR